MKTSNAFTITILTTIVVSLLCIWFYPSVQDFMAGNTMWNGIDDFSDEFEAENIDTLEGLPDSSEGSVLVAIPYIEYTQSALEFLERFVNNGGTLLLMDDYGYGNQVLGFLGLTMRFSSEPLLDPLFCYKNQWMPKITDFNEDIASENITLVLLNHATTLTDIDGTILAYSSATSFLDRNEDGKKNGNESEGPFIIAAEKSYGKGTVIAVSDPSVLISSMIDRDDNYRFIQYLLSRNGVQGNVIIDRSHLSKTPLDNSKIRLFDVREFVSNPYALTGVIALIFVVISRYTIRKGEAIG
ncbi:MAG: hypothetical protein JW712_02515 [Dehalococcoidales bacterium]|nr:hypothetical protein [Dehalococcoidales bacterium]